MSSAPINKHKRLPLAPGDPMYCIFRTEANVDGFGGYWLVSVRRARMQYNASFFDRAFQGTERALQAAQTFRDALLERLPSIALLRVIRERKTPSGVKGVQRVNHGDQVCWHARLRINGKSFGRYFSTTEYGDEGAKQRAIAARITWLKELGLENMPSLPSKQEVRQLAETIGTRLGEQKAGRPTPKNTFNEKDQYGISRREADAHGQGGCWKVALSRGHIKHEKNFYDGTEGGKEVALIVARRYRDNLLTRIKPLTLKERYQIRRSDNTSGEPGVRLRKKNGVAVAWRAVLVLQGRHKTKNFSIQKYGYEGAFELASEARQTLLEQIKADYYLHSPAAKAWYDHQPTSSDWNLGREDTDPTTLD